MAKWESCQVCGQKARGHFIHLVDQPSNKIKNSFKGYMNRGLWEQEVSLIDRSTN
jgi:hypothetical protein